MPFSVASIWIVRIAFLAVILYFSLIVGLLVAALLIVARIFSRAYLSVDEEPAQWRNGMLGFGMYTQEGSRIDPHESEHNQ